MNETLSLFGIVLCLLCATLVFCIFKFAPKRKVALITFKKKNVKFYGLCGHDYEYITVTDIFYYQNWQLFDEWVDIRHFEDFYYTDRCGMMNALGVS